MRLSIENPWILLGLVPLACIFVFTARFLAKRKVRHLKLTCIVHILAVMCLLLALSGIGLSVNKNETNTVFVVDLSDSMMNYRGMMESFVSSAIEEMPENNYAGIITFGADARMEQFLSDKKVFSKFQTAPVKTASNIEEAMIFAQTMLDDSKNQRIVLITDGKQNEGDVSSLSQLYRNKAIEFKVLKIEEEITSEVYIDTMSIPEKISRGDTFTINVRINSNISTDAALYLYQGRTLKGTKSIHLENGENQFVFTDVLSETGMAGYRAVVDAAADTQTVNNEYYAYTTIEAPSRVLVIEGSPGNSSQFLEVLEAANISGDHVTASGVPKTIDQLLEYRCIITVDVHSDDLTDTFMELLKTYVRDYGGGFIATGGENSFALGAYRNTPLEEILPVSMDLIGEKEVPQMSMVMVIDHSTSMGDGKGYTTNLDLAKAAAANALDNLRATDKAGILGFSDTFSWNSPLTVLSDREGVKEAVYSIPLSGGTSIYPA